MNSKISNINIFEFLQQHNPFNLLTKDCLSALVKLLSLEFHKGNSLIIKKGGQDSDLFILMKGRLLFQITDANNTILQQGDLPAGSIIGEMSLLTNLERSANVYSVRDSITLKLTQKDFLNLCQKYPELLHNFTKFTINRLTQSLQGIQAYTPSNKSVALIPLSTFPQLEEQLKKLFETSSLNSKIIFLTKDFFSKLNFLFADGSLNSEGILWINNQADNFEYMFYLAETSASLWTQFCVRQTDSIILLADGNSKEYSITETEKFIGTMQNEIPKNRTLVLLQSANAPKNTHKWLQDRNLNQHFHVQLENNAGKARLLRILTDKTISLVLSGGGARGLAHIGVFKALEELNIPVDNIAGTSMGAIIAALFAMGNNSQESTEIIKNYLPKSSKIDLTFPYIAISSGKRASMGLQYIFGENTRIEDLWINFFCVSTDLISQNLFIHQQGQVWKALRSSMSLPFIYPPVSYEDHLLLDGGVLNNLPVDVMRKLAPLSQIIAANINDNMIFKLNDLPHNLSGWRLLYNKFRGKESLLPISLGDLVFRLLTICSHQNTEQMLALADYRVELDMEPYGMIDFKKTLEISHKGYIQALALLKQQNVSQLNSYSG